jgi:hypothetical protein
MIDLAQKLAAWLTSRRRVPDTERCTRRPSVITLTNGGWGGKGAPCALCGDLRDRG